VENDNENNNVKTDEWKKSYRVAWKKVPMVSQLFKLLTDPKPIE
jgi:hypothetical protein